MKSEGTIFIVGGVNDPSLLSVGWKLGLRWAGLPHRIECFRWQQGLWAVLCYADLWRTEHHQRKADEFANILQNAEPPVHILAHSAGTAISAYALERLPATICSAAFVGSGLSPRYDLQSAIKACEYGLLSVESPLDCFTLGIGTTLLGTCDRRHSPAAGMLGFQAPLDPVCRSKFYRCRWSPRMLKQGWTGGHTTERSPWFAQHSLAPWIRQAEGAVPDSESGFRAKIHSSIG